MSINHYDDTVLPIEEQLYDEVVLPTSTKVSFRPVHLLSTTTTISNQESIYDDTIIHQSPTISNQQSIYDDTVLSTTTTSNQQSIYDDTIIDQSPTSASTHRTRGIAIVHPFPSERTTKSRSQSYDYPVIDHNKRPSQIHLPKRRRQPDVPTSWCNRRRRFIITIIILLVIVVCVTIAVVVTLIVTKHNYQLSPTNSSQLFII